MDAARGVFLFGSVATRPAASPWPLARRRDADLFPSAELLSPVFFCSLRIRLTFFLGLFFWLLFFGVPFFYLFHFFKNFSSVYRRGTGQVDRYRVSLPSFVTEFRYRVFLVEEFF